MQHLTSGETFLLLPSGTAGWRERTSGILQAFSTASNPPLHSGSLVTQSPPKGLTTLQGFNSTWILGRTTVPQGRVTFVFVIATSKLE